jgi:hypothetical protein
MRAAFLSLVAKSVILPSYPYGYYGLMQKDCFRADPLAVTVIAAEVSAL